MQNEDRLRALLSNLGRSTLRGVRKCPKCGTYNGTRGLSCKNKACDVVFKEAGDKKKQSMEVCKLDTGTSTQIFSVRVRDKGPDYRGFVQLPVMKTDRAMIGNNDTSYITQVSALCFVDSCQRLFNTSILKCHERDEMQGVGTCAHIQSALRCRVNAQALIINNNILSSMMISQQYKEGVWQLATETPGPLVQRVSKTIMAVKCKVTTKHPLGYLHLSFFPSAVVRENHFSCTCTSYKNLVKNGNGEGLIKSCVHYYACIAAFASDPKLSQEFSQFIDSSIVNHLGVEEDESENPLSSLLSSSMNHCTVEVEVLAECASSFLNKDILLPDAITQLEVMEGLSSVVDVTGALESSDPLHADDPLLNTVLEPPNTHTHVHTKRKAKSVRKKKTTDEGAQKKKKDKKDPIKKYFKISGDVTKMQQTFIEWLSSVTERINQTMHFQFDGKPEPLVFHTPQIFFDCLMERFLAPSIGVRRRRLPNQVTTFTRKTAPPLGTFYNYTWHISNILHAKAIFDTPLMVLNVTRSFIQNPDGTYEDFDATEEEILYPKKDGEPSIRPSELKTYLKIGKTSPEQETPSLLSIDWTPNVLPLSKIGELKITFEYGHMHPKS